MGILSRFLAPQPMLVAPLLPGPGSGDEEGWKVTSSGGDFRHVGPSRHTGDAWWGRKEERGEGAALEVGKHKVSLEKYIEDWVVLGVRWEGSVGLSWKGLVVQSLES